MSLRLGVSPKEFAEEMPYEIKQPGYVVLTHSEIELWRYSPSSKANKKIFEFRTNPPEDQLVVLVDMLKMTREIDYDIIYNTLEDLQVQSDYYLWVDLVG